VLPGAEAVAGGAERLARGFQTGTSTGPSPGGGELLRAAAEALEYQHRGCVLVQTAFPDPARDG
jgi:hypothetical protein